MGRWAVVTGGDVGDVDPGTTGEKMSPSLYADKILQAVVAMNDAFLIFAAVCSKSALVSFPVDLEPGDVVARWNRRTMPEE